jgi:hypothetical protein
MMLEEIVKKIKPFVLGWITSSGGGAGPYAPMLHDIEEEPAGTKDGSNCVFVLSAVNYPNTLIVFINGLIRKSNLEFEETPPNSFTLASPPSPTDALSVTYRMS